MKTLPLLAMLLVSTVARAANPFITSIYTADPSAHVWADGRLYVYPSRDIDPPRGCDLMDHYHVFSTDNMVDWRDEGEILNASQVPWGRKEGGFMWAPDAAFRNGHYYFYFPHPSDTDWNASWKIGVAISDKPASDFKALGILQGVGGFSMIDPAVFVDDDGQAYLYYGGGGHCAAAKLKPSMTEVDGLPVPMEGLHDFHEATWVFKRNKTYYLSYADNHPENNCMEYATSSSPLGPWTSKGVYLESTGCDTTHGSVVEYKGQWYQFYHNKSISGQGNLRSICVDRLDFNDDGTIKTVVQTKTGPPAAVAVDDSNAPAPPPQPKLTPMPYWVEGATLGPGATTQTDDATQHMTAHDFQNPGASLQWDKVSGGESGGRAMLDFTYATQDHARVHLEVNGADYSFLNAVPTANWDTYTGHIRFTVPLNAGDTNTVKLSGASWGVNISGMTVTLLP